MSQKYDERQPKARLKGGDNPEFAHIQPVQCEPLQVKVYNNFDRALKAFRAIVQKEKILSQYKEKSSYEKPSEKRRRKQSEYIRKLAEEEGKFLSAPKKRKKRKTKKLEKQST